MHDVIISPSVLSADLFNLSKDLEAVEKGGADWHHIDVMDGHFVPNLTFGLPFVRALKKKSTLPLDVHIMVQNPDDVATMYVEAGADILTFHLEAASNPQKIIDQIKSVGSTKASMAIRPQTPVEDLEPFLDSLDMVLIMSVNPGFSGQKFMEGAYQRISTLNSLLQKRGREDLLIQVDGGVSDANIKELYQAGARSFVAGSYIYDHEDRQNQITKLKMALGA